MNNFKIKYLKFDMFKNPNFKIMSFEIKNYGLIISSYEINYPGLNLILSYFINSSYNIKL